MRIVVIAVVLVSLAGCAQDSDSIAERPEANDPPAQPPQMSWSQSEAGDYVQVMSADEGVRWSDFDLRFDVAGYWDTVADSGSAGNGAPADLWVRGPAEPMDAGARAYFCLSGDQAGPLTVQLRHAESGSLVKEFNFSSVKRC